MAHAVINLVDEYFSVIRNYHYRYFRLVREGNHTFYVSPGNSPAVYAGAFIREEAYSSVNSHIAVKFSFSEIVDPVQVSSC